MVDPDMSHEDDAPQDESEDTKTRKTVRLRPSATPSGINLTPLPKTSLTDPLSGRDTDTGNLEVMEDTQTRRTVKLRPIATQTSDAPKMPLTPKPAGDGANTQTRKTIVLKPTAVAPSVKIESPTGAAPKESDDTKTRKTVRLRPSAVTPPPMATGAAPAAEEGSGSIESSDTIKIARPPRPGSMIPPRPMMPFPGQAASHSDMPSHSLPVAKPLPPQTPLPKPGEEGPISTAVPHIPAVPRIPAAPGAVAAPEAATTAPRPLPTDDELKLKPAGSSNAAAPTAMNGPEAGAATGGVDSAMPTLDGKSPLAAMQPLAAAKTGASKFYLGIAVACLILIAGTVTLTAVQYLNLCQQQNIELPFLSQSK